MGFRSVLGKASGATLGFISGNFPGAYIGYKVGEKLTQNNMKRKGSFKYPRSKKSKLAPYRRMTKRVSKRRSYKRKTYRRKKYASRQVGTHQMASTNFRFVVNKKLKDKATGRQTFTQEYSGSIGNTTYIGSTTDVSNSGEQAVCHLGAMNTVSQIITSTGTGYDSFSAGKSFFDLNPNQKVSGGSVYTAGTIPLGDKLGIQRCSLEAQLMNNTNVDCTISLYVVKCLKDTEDDPIVKWENALADDALGITDTTTRNTSTDPQQLGNPTIYRAGQIPMDCPQWKKYWKVVKVLKFDLAGGSNETVKIKCKQNSSVLKADVTRQGADGIRFLRNVSWTVFAIARGQTVRDAQTTPNPRFTIGSVLIGVTMLQKWYLNYLKDASSKFAPHYLGLSFTKPSFADEKMMDVEDNPDTAQRS